MDNPQKSSLMSYIFTYNLVNKNNVTVSIDGQGADEIQGGYIMNQFLQDGFKVIIFPKSLK